MESTKNKNNSQVKSHDNHQDGDAENHQGQNHNTVKDKSGAMTRILPKMPSLTRCELSAPVRSEDIKDSWIAYNFRSREKVIHALKRQKHMQEQYSSIKHKK